MSDVWFKRAPKVYTGIPMGIGNGNLVPMTTKVPTEIKGLMTTKVPMATKLQWQQKFQRQLSPNCNKKIQNIQNYRKNEM